MIHLLVRVDASVATGTGHVMRCLTLADALRARGAAVTFACRPDDGDMIETIRIRGFDCVPVSAAAEDEDAIETAAFARNVGAHRVIVDHYGLGAHWEAAMPVPVMAIDDLRRVHLCDLLLDQNQGTTAASYNGLVPEGTRILAGPVYALLRPAFARLRPDALAVRRGRPLRRILVSMGGTDPINATSWALRAISGSVLPEAVTVVLGPAAPHLEAVRALLPTLPFNAKLLVGTDHMAELMFEADLAVGAAGSSSWERCCLGLPTIALVIAENQADIAKALEAAGAVEVVDLGKDLDLRNTLRRLSNNPEKLARMQTRAAALCDGTGAELVASEILGAETVDRMRISVVVDPPGGWFDPYARELVRAFDRMGHEASLVTHQSDVPQGDVAYYLSCMRITPPELLGRNRVNAVVHASALPRGRGFSPLAWQVLEGRNEIPLTMIGMTEDVDAGAILSQRTFSLGGYELNDEMRETMGAAIVEMCVDHVRAGAPTSGRPQTGEASWYRRRRPEDSRVDVHRSIADQFDLLRVVDNDRYPAFFDHRGHRYTLRVERIGPTSPEDRP